MDKYLIALTYIENLGPITLKKILKHLAPEEAWRASLSDLLQAGLNKNFAQSIIEHRVNLNPNQIIEQLEKEKIKVLTFYDNDYPKLLKEIYNPPIVIYYKGDPNILSNQYLLSIVGTRKITNYGKTVLENFLSILVNYGFVIISGLALGSDAYAHQLTLNNNGTTIAVLGSGLDLIYPRANFKLSQEIIKSGGLIISEFPLGTLPLKQNFPYRNRVISGLSKATFITEADIKSGAMITAKFALEQNREVLALPGNILQKQSTGTNKLIQAGAKIITEVNDILEVYGLTENQLSPHNDNQLPLNFDSKEEELIYSLIKDGYNNLDQLKIQSQLQTNVLNANLTMLEIKGVIKNINGEFVV